MAASTVPRDILDAAARLVADEGPEVLTMDRLAGATGLSRATLYRQCGSREAVLDALAAEGRDVGDRTDTRTRILAAARDVFGRTGFDRATMEEIAEAANVGLATMYRYFRDKDGLVSAFLDELAPRRAAREARARATGDLRADLERLAELMLTGMRDDASIVRLVLLEMLRGGPLLPRIRTLSPTRTLGTVASILRDHTTAGRLRDINPRVLAQAFAGMVLAFGVIAPIVRGEPAADPRAAARTLTDLFLHGALVRKDAR